MNNKLIKVLEIGPSVTRSKGGMATVIDGIYKDKVSFQGYKIDLFDSFIDGNKLKRLMFCIYAYIKFHLLYKQYDIFHIHMASYGSTFRKIKYIKFLKRNNKKVIVHVHGAAYMEFYRALNDKRKKMITDTINEADLVIALSETWKCFFENEIKFKNVVVLNNAVDTKEFKNININRNQKVNKLLFLGRLGKRKGTYDLIYAIKALKDMGVLVKCIFAGDGEIEKAKMLAEELGVLNQLEFTGWIDTKKKMKLLKSIEVIVLPSYNEGLPMTILEGMASGKIIISTTVGAIPEVIIEEENGFLIEPGDITKLAEVIKYVYENEEILEKISKNNIAKIDKYFNIKKINRKLENHFYNIYTR